MKGTKTVAWILQFICIIILLPEAWGKLSSQAGSMQLFAALGMEPTGRYLIGLIELLSCILLLIGRFSAVGAFLALATMLGAIIAHVTVLGYNVMGDEGRHVILLVTVLISALLIMTIRRGHLPFVSGLLKKEHLP